VPLADELAFVERYLAIERIRFDARLDVRLDVSDEAKATLVPSFALQTLVENAVRHGAAPRVEPTMVEITGRTAADTLTVTVHDTGGGASPEQIAQSRGTGLARLRDRLAVLYRGRARLDVSTSSGGGFTASLSVPLDADE
jgi:LytS/YehU family sensor histidine kinase